MASAYPHAIEIGTDAKKRQEQEPDIVSICSFEDDGNSTDDQDDEGTDEPKKGSVSTIVQYLSGNRSEKTERKKFRFYLFIPERWITPAPTQAKLYLKVFGKRTVKKKLKQLAWFNRLWITNEIEIPEYEIPNVRYRYALRTSNLKEKEEKSRSLSSKKSSGATVCLWDEFTNGKHSDYDLALSEILAKATLENTGNMFSMPDVAKPLKKLEDKTRVIAICKKITASESTPIHVADKLGFLIVINSKAKDIGSKFLDEFKRARNRLVPNFLGILHYFLRFTPMDIDGYLEIHTILTKIPNLSDKAVIGSLEKDFIEPNLTRRKYKSLIELISYVQLVQSLLPKLPRAVTYFESTVTETIDKRQLSNQEIGILITITMNTAHIFETPQSIEMVLEILKSTKQEGVLNITQLFLDTDKVQTCKKGDIPAYLCDWMKNALRSADSSTERDIKKYYKYYDHIDKTYVMQGIEENDARKRKVQAVVVQKMRNVATITEILEASENIQKGSNLFYSHCKDLIQYKMKGIDVADRPLMLLVDGFGGCKGTKSNAAYVIKRRETALSIVALLESVHAKRPNYTLDLKTIKFFVDNHEFLKWVCAIDKKFGLIRKSQAMEIVNDFGAQVVQAIEGQKIHCHTLVQLDKNLSPNALINFLAVMTTKDKDQIEDAWVAALQKLKNYDKNVKKTEKMLNFLLQFENMRNEHGRTIHIRNRDVLTEAIEKLKGILTRSESEVSVCQIEEIDFWNENNLAYVYQLAIDRNRSRACSFVSFVNFIKKYKRVLKLQQQSVTDEETTEVHQADTQTEEQENKQRPNICYAAINDVAKAVWKTEYEEFTTLLFEHFCKEQDIGIRVIYHLFGDVFDLDKEIKGLKTCVPRFGGRATRGLGFWKNKKPLLELYESINALCKTFSVPFEETEANRALMLLQNIQENLLENITFLQFSDILSEARREIGDISDIHKRLICELGKAEGLIAFLNKTMDDYLPEMLNGVGQYSDDVINIGTINDLINVNSVLKPLLHQLAAIPKLTCQDLLKHIVGLQASKTLCDKIAECAQYAGALKTLHMNLTNKKELEKIKLKQILDECKVHIEGNQEEITVVFVNEKATEISSGINVESKDQIATMTYEDAKQLKTKVLLLVNTAATSGDDMEKDRDEADRNRKFIQLMDNIHDLTEQLSKLQLAGHLKYQILDLDIETKELLAVDENTNFRELEKYKKYFTQWQDDLDETRKLYKHLNFIYGRQIKTLVDFFKTSGSKVEAEAILQYIFPNIYAGAAEEVRRIPQDEHRIRQQLVKLGECLNQLDSAIQKKTKRPAFRTLKSTVAKKYLRKVLIMNIPKAASISARENGIPQVMLDVCSRLEVGLPHANQIIFCSRETHPEEICLLLERCFKHYGSETKFHCIVNAELLPTATKEIVLHHLADKIKQSDNVEYSLAFLFQAKENDHFIEKLQKIPNTLSMLRSEVIESIDASEYSHNKIPVVTVTSECPGQGKTAFIRRFAADRNLGIKTLYIEGEVNRNTIIEDLFKLGNLKHNLLHIDIRATSNTDELDNILFQLISLGNLSFRGKCAICPNSAIGIEISNSVQNCLQDSLPYTTSFAREHIQWKGFKNLVVPSESNSDIQTIARYLDIEQKGQLDHLNVSDKKQPFTSAEVIELFQNVFKDDVKSFNVLTGLNAMLADQFKRFTNSDFFAVQNIKQMVIGKHSKQIRSTLFDAVKDQTNAFGPKHQKGVCVKHVKPSLSRTKSEKFHEAVLASTEAITEWDDFKHDVILFNNKDSQTITILYRLFDNLSPAIQNLVKMQSDKSPTDPLGVSEVNWRAKLDLLAGQWTDSSTEVDENLGNLAKTYSLTRDNVLKMALILLRLRSKVPVILMGETGCGKTTLIKYLAYMSEAKFKPLNVHSGTTRERIVEFMDKVLLEEQDTETDVWLFFDEMNTCEHQGLISEIMCHRRYKGKNVPINMAFLAACNPYKKRDKDSVLTPGLETKAKFDEISELVYRVNPLPVTVLDYVWNYGSLTEEDEKKYIDKMLENLFDTKDEVCTVKKYIPEAVRASQRFVRELYKSPWVVSLRDVQRCKDLMVWFYKMLWRKHKSKFIRKNYRAPSTTDGFYYRAVYLALAQCYQVRLRKASQRRAYWREISKVLFGNEKSADTVLQEIREEQADIIDRMDIPLDIAKTPILLENVFVMFVSILTKTPTFVVGKPGCSKSLSMHLLSTNLRGLESNDAFFKTLPMFYVIPYQGSEVSTSDGIEKVFKWAKGHAKADNIPKPTNLPKTATRRFKRLTLHFEEEVHTVLPVVLLDEIGLAEISPYNPLKVLHSLLETDKGEELDIAVIGISNWALDAAKMNRAIHVSCPDMEEADLLEIARCMRDSIYNEQFGTGRTSGEFDEAELKPLEHLAQAYMSYTRNMTFHGARDFYSLTKFIVRKRTEDQSSSSLKEIVLEGVQRNFGGKTPCPTKHFIERTVFKGQAENLESKPLEALIVDNIVDTTSRHLMVISKTTSDLSFIIRLLENQGKKCEVLIGSNYPGDANEAYLSRVLSEVILCMENGSILIMKDLKKVYTSLYEMLNQNYRVVKSTNKKSCRIALGPYRNPLCDVHENFKCVVMMEEKEIPRTDAPFLNRFEKQLFSFSAVQDDKQKLLCKRLQSWVSDFAKVNEDSSSKEGSLFETTDAFVGFSTDTIPSLVLNLCAQYPEWEAEYIERIAQDILMTTCPKDAILRLSYSPLSEIESTAAFLTPNAETTDSIQEKYFQTSITQDGLEEFMKKFSESHDKDKMHKVVIYTHTPYFTHVDEFLDVSSRSSEHDDEHTDSNSSDNADEPNDASASPMNAGNQILVKRLGEFHSEKELSTTAESFFGNTHQKWFFIRCTPLEDTIHLPLAKAVLDKQIKSTKVKQIEKYVCFIVHIDKRLQASSYSLHLSYLDNWLFYTIDQLKTVHVNDKQLKTLEILQLDEAKAIQELLDVEAVIRENIQWAFSCMKYDKEIDKSVIETLISKISGTQEIVGFIVHKVLSIISQSTKFNDDKKFDPNNWQIKLAKHVNVWEGDSLHSIWEKYLETKVKYAMAIVISQIRRLSAWESYFTDDDEDKKQIWMKLVEDPEIVEYPLNIGAVGYETIVIENLPVALQCPFSRVFTQRLKKISSDMKEEIDIKLQEKEGIEDETASIKGLTDEEKARTVEAFLNRVSSDLEPVRHEELYMNQYMGDFYADLIASEFPLLPIEECSQLCKLLFFNFDPDQSMDTIRYLTHVLLEYTLNQEEVYAFCQFIERCKSLSQAEDIGQHLNEAIKAVAKDSSKSKYMDGLCEAVIPTSAAITDLGLPRWLSFASSFISAITGTDYNSDLLEILKVLRDFSLIFVTSEASSQIAAEVGKLGETVKQHKGNFHEGLKKILKRMLDIRKIIPKEHNEEEFLHFVLLLFARVLRNSQETDITIDALSFIVKNYMSGRKGICVAQILQVILKPMFEIEKAKDEDEESEPTLLSIIEDKNEGNDLAVVINQFFEMSQISDICHPLCLLIIDIFQTELKSLYEDDLLMAIFELQSIYEIQLPDYPTKPTLQLCAKVALLRLFIETTAKNIRFVSDTERKQVLDATLTKKSKEDPNWPLALFLKSLPCRCVPEIEEECSNLTEIESLKNLQFSDSVFYAIVYNPFICLVDENIRIEGHQEPVANNFNVTELLRNCGNEDLGDFHLQAFLVYLAQEYYLPSLVKRVLDSSRQNQEVMQIYETIDDDNLYKLYDGDMRSKLRILAKILTGQISYVSLLEEKKIKSDRNRFENAQIANFVVHAAIAFMPLCTRKNAREMRRSSILQLMLEGKEELAPAGIDEKEMFFLSFCRNKHVIFGQHQQCPKCKMPSIQPLPIPLNKANETCDQYKKAVFLKDIEVVLLATFRFLGVTFKETATESEKQTKLRECEIHLKSELSQLKSSSGLAIEDFYLMLNAIVFHFAKHTDQLQDEKLEDKLQLFMQNKTTSIEKYRDMILTRINCDPKSLEAQIYEWNQNKEIDDNRACMRMVRKPTTENLKFEFQIQSLNDTRLSLAALLVQMERYIKLLNHLCPLISWMKCTRLALSGLKTQRECERMKIKELCEQSQLTDATFDSFRKAWNELVTAVETLLQVDPSLSQLQSIGISETTPISPFLASTRDSHLFKVVKVLMGIQNTFLLRALGICSKTKSYAAEFVNDNGCIVLQATDIHEAKTQNIVTAEITDKFLYIEVSLLYGHGKEWNFDRQQIERNVAFACLKEKRFLTVQDPERLLMHFKDTAPNPIGKLLDQVTTICNPQKELPSSIRQDLISQENKQKGFYGRVQDILGHVLVRMTKDSCAMADSLHDFLQEKFSRAFGFARFIFSGTENVNTEKETFFKEHTNLKLSHVVALYEFIEEQCALQDKMGLPLSYNRELGEDGKQQLDGFMKATKIPRIELEKVFLKVIVRHIALERQFRRNIDPDENLLTIMEDEFLWCKSERNPDGGLKPEFAKMLPVSLKAGEIVSILKYIEHEQDELRETQTQPLMRTKPTKRSKAKPRPRQADPLFM